MYQLECCRPRPGRARRGLSDLTRSVAALSVLLLASPRAAPARESVLTRYGRTTTVMLADYIEHDPAGADLAVACEDSRSD